MRLAILLAVIGVATATEAGLDRAVPAQPTLQSLKDLGAFTVSVRGTSLESFPSKLRCVYFEWAVGEHGATDWLVRYATSHSGQPITVDTPSGSLSLRHGEIRLYLPPSRSVSYTRDKLDAAPVVVREYLKEAPILTLQEFVLEPGRQYHAQVDAETYLLPPEPGGVPRRRQALVLAISDLPFRNGRAQRPLTPTFVGSVY